jgi:uncharacterized membrane protein
VIRFFARVGFAVVCLLCLVGIASVVYRFVNTVEYLADPAAFGEFGEDPPGAAGFEARYYAHPYLTLVHVATGFLFMTLGPLQFLASIRNRFLAFHRWSGRVFLAASLAGAISALAFVWTLPVFGSFSTQVGVVCAATYFLVALVQGYRRIRRREIAQHREWMIRLFAVGLGISTFRVLIPVLMMPPFGATFPDAWDTVVWLGFLINAAVAEVWINVTRKRPEVRGHLAAMEINPAARRPARPAEAPLAR